MATSQEREYRARINAVMDYIQDNIDKPLLLNELAKVANFSPYHFHRIFSSYIGETLNSFIQRLRIEKAASMLIANPGKSITEIAFDYGFSSSASFARLFKDMYGMSASQWRSGGYKSFSKICKTESKICKTDSNGCKESPPEIRYLIGSTSVNGGANLTEKIDTNCHSGRIEMSFSKKPAVEVKSIPAFTVAYVRHIGPYKGNSQLFEDLFSKLTTWAGPRGLLDQPDLKFLNIYHDDPEITDENNLRLSVCVSVPKDTKVDGDIGKMEIAAGKYAVGHFEIDVDQYQDAWDYMFGEWMPKSGYQPNDGVCYELMVQDPEKHPEHKHVIEIHVPVKPL